MKKIPTRYWRWGGLGAVVALFAWEVALWRREAGRTRDAQQVVRRQAAEHERLLNLDPRPTAEAGRLLAEEIAQLHREREVVVSQLGIGVAEPIVSDAGDPLEVFFQVSAFTEAARAAGIAAGVRIHAKENFGFELPGPAAPAREGLLVMLRQRDAVDRLLRALWQARPAELLGVKHELPSSVPVATRDTSRSSRDAAPVQERLATDKFLLEFAGSTSALRALLNELADAAPAIWVRKVEVAAGTSQDSQAETGVVVQGGPSRFMIEVEAGRGSGTGGAEFTALWPDRGMATEAWDFELFTSPAVFRDRQGMMTLVKPAPRRPEIPGESWQLVAVEPEPFRVQLAGYLGTPGRALAILIEPGSRRTHLVGEGRRAGETGVVLQRLEFDTVNDSGIRERIVRAEVRDVRSGREFMLDGRGWKYTDQMVATMRSNGPRGAGVRLQARAGEIVEIFGRRHRVDQMKLAPPEVRLVPLEATRPGEGALLLRAEGVQSTEEIAVESPSDRTEALLPKFAAATP